MEELSKVIQDAFNTRDLLNSSETQSAVQETIKLLDAGKIRVATPPEKNGEDWIVHSWIKQAILLYFSIQKMQTIEVGPFEYHDKIPLKNNYAAGSVRIVPPAVARYGSFIESGAILMPSYINIGGYVSSGSMVDTWATVGSCAQVGKNVHLSGGVGLGGVLEPPTALPVIIEDGAFIGSRCIVVEGVRIEKEAVLGANVTITSTTPIIDVTGSSAITLKGRVPARSVVVPGSIPKTFPAGTFNVACALIIGTRKESTDKKTSLNDVLREFNVSV